ncbi:hypothetical protein DesLBE_2701 [Desulfitobacterium sp. LBE]|uniref:hypothetical protein n=1 Tax=Desulfitobacterium sp. LBE TaxID=884086 RepID=UPI001199D726|nr:hypothetical protein [Desulfitobacterium sp. LBE]TWH58383.1 hypothetical protein DesLBE_2701 [Desulfitobacterium sp. LBE]
MSNYPQYHVLDAIEADCKEYLEEYLQASDLQEKQMILIQGIRTLDFLFSESVRDDINQEYRQKLTDALLYGYPSFLSQTYNDFTSMKNIPLHVSTKESIVLSNRAVYACELLGRISNFRELVGLNVLEIKENTSRRIHLSFIEKYPWIEFIEKENVLKYSSLIQKSQMEKYEILVKNHEKVINKMASLVYLWKSNFIGYKTTPEIDNFYHYNASFDAVEATEWDVFPERCTFGGVPYRAYVDTVVYFMSFALKHMQYCHILLQKYPHLKIHNLLCTINVQSETISLIKGLNNVTLEDAKKIFDTIILDNNNLYQHIYLRSAPPPLIQLSKHQFIRSICGCLDRPFEFMLDTLRHKYPKEWDSNTKLREEEFRKDLYSLFEDGTSIKIDREIVISENGKMITDIDACIIDKITGEIAFIQLKWQDLVYNNNKILLSKKRNYEKKTKEWILAIKDWLNYASEKRIADYLGVSAKMIDKSKIKLFVIGRFNGNFSGNDIPDNNVVWGQWYQVLLFMGQLRNKDRNITTLYEYLKKSNPYNIPIVTQPVIYRIGDRTLKFG